MPAGLDFARVSVEPPRDPSHGDLATNAAMVLAKAVELGKVRKGDRVGLLGIGSGLNCQMAEVVW